MEKILYITDLDGTLLGKSQTVSAKTAGIINQLIEKGLIFSFATARSLITASKALAGIRARVPASIYNGVFLAEPQTGRLLFPHYFQPHESKKIFSLLSSHHIAPIVYAHRDGAEKFSYCARAVNAGMKSFLDSRKGDIRDNPVGCFSELAVGDIFYFTCIGKAQELHQVYRLLKDTFYCVYQKDLYSGEQWLEILPRCATKANAVLQLKRMLACTKVVSFGDGKNDIPLFQVSDACYAVENADPELKALATGVIKSNEEDGVAEWLLQHGAF